MEYSEYELKLEKIRTHKRPESLTPEVASACMKAVNSAIKSIVEVIRPIEELLPENEHGAFATAMRDLGFLNAILVRHF